MVGNLHLGRAAGNGQPATIIHRLRRLHAVLPEPVGDLKVGQYGHLEPRGDRRRVGHVVGMGVGDEDRVALHILGLQRGCRAIVEKRIDEQDATTGVDEPGGVADPGERDRHRRVSSASSYGLKRRIMNVL